MFKRDFGIIDRRANANGKFRVDPPSYDRVNGKIQKAAAFSDSSERGVISPVSRQTVWRISAKTDGNRQVGQRIDEIELRHELKI